MVELQMAGTACVLLILVVIFLELTKISKLLAAIIAAKVAKPEPPAAPMQAEGFSYSGNGFAEPLAGSVYTGKDRNEIYAKLDFAPKTERIGNTIVRLGPKNGD